MYISCQLSFFLTKIKTENTLRQVRLKPKKTNKTTNIFCYEIALQNVLVS
jgi:hypothetical protein